MNKQFKVLTLIAAVGFSGAANAASCGENIHSPGMDLNYGASVWGQVTANSAATLQSFSDSEQTSAGGSCASGDASIVGGAAFGGVPLMHAQATSFVGVGSGDIQAGLFDTLTFHIAGGGSADVLAQISGNWTATVGSRVTYNLGLSSLGGADLAFPDIFGSPSDPFASIPTSGSYTDGGLWHVNDGHSYRIYARVYAAGWGGGSAYIDDPLTFQLPSGVTFASASGSTYVAAVPLPATVWLFGSGLLGLIGVARRKAARSV